MAHSEPWARRLLREMKSPRELLRRRRYRTPMFLRLFLDQVEELRFRDPQAALKFAKVGPQLALLVPEAESDDGRLEYSENLLRAHRVLAGAYRVTGRHAASDSQYALAQEIACSEAISTVARADLNLCIATLRASQNRFAEALELVDGAETTFRAAGEQRRLAEALAVRGYVLNEDRQFARAIPFHGKALTLALRLERTKPTDPADVAALARVVEAARANMAWAIAHSPDTGFAATALGYISAGHQELRGRRDSLTRHLLQWSEGMVYTKLNLDGRAVRRLETARRGFVRLNVPWETALVSLDLAALYRAGATGASGEEWELLEDLAADTFHRFCDLCGDYEAIAALKLWLEAAQARTGANVAIDTARKVLTVRRAQPRA